MINILNEINTLDVFITADEVNSQVELSEAQGIAPCTRGKYSLPPGEIIIDDLIQ